MSADIRYASSLGRGMVAVVVKNFPIRSCALWNQFGRFELERPGLLPVPVASTVPAPAAVTASVSTSATIAITAIVPAVSAFLMLLRPVLAKTVLAHLLV